MLHNGVFVSCSLQYCYVTEWLSSISLSTVIYCYRVVRWYNAILLSLVMHYGYVTELLFDITLSTVLYCYRVVGVSG